MSNTIKPTILFKRPEFIEAVVIFPLPDGTEAKLACKFQYRTRKEFGALWDEISASANDLAKPKPRAKSKGKEVEPEALDVFTYEGMIQRGTELNAENSLKYLKGWPEELPKLTKEALMQLFDEVASANGAFWNTYSRLCAGGVSGN